MLDWDDDYFLFSETFEEKYTIVTNLYIESPKKKK